MLCIEEGGLYAHTHTPHNLPVSSVSSSSITLIVVRERERERERGRERERERERERAMMNVIGRYVFVSKRESHIKTCVGRCFSSEL